MAEVNTLIADGVLPKCRVRRWRYGIMFFDVFDVNGIWQPLARILKGQLKDREYESRRDGWYRVHACGEDVWHKIGVGFRLTEDLPQL